MGTCDNLCQSSTSKSKNTKQAQEYKSNEISFRCTYEVEDYEEIQIINDRYKPIKGEKEIINYEIKSKIKILNGKNKENLIMKKKFKNIGINTVDFIIEQKLTNVRLMFYGCKSLIQIEFISFDTSSVTDMSGMFQGCKKLKYFNLANFNTFNVIDMGWMFSHCEELKEIKGINYFNTSHVVRTSAMFQGCHEIEYLDLSNFNTKEVEEMDQMFCSCFQLKEIKVLNAFNTSKVENMDVMFQGCKKIKYLNLTNFDTYNVTSMQYMFACCYSLKEIKGINHFNTSKVKNMKAMFQK